MERHLPLCLCLVLGLASAAPAQTMDPTPPEASSTPAWLPRGAFLGTYYRSGAVVPQARLQWEALFFQERYDALAVILEGGGGPSVAMPDTPVEWTEAAPTRLYLYTGMAGVGYRSQRPSSWHWGFHVISGVVWYGAHFKELPKEKYLAGMLDGRLQVGHQVGPVVLGVGVGYGAPFNYRRRSLGRHYVGGLQVGLFADWR